MKTTGKAGIRWLGRVLCAGAAVIAALALGQPAHAYTLKSVGACPTIKWTTPNPVYKVHIYEFVDGGGDLDDLTALFSAVYDVMREFNNVAGTSATVDVSGINSDARAYDPDTPFNDPDPTIHIGFTGDPNKVDASGTARASTKFSVNQTTCTYNETRITFRDESLQQWDFGTPSTAGDKYYTTNDTDPAGKMWFRPVMLHELLHSFGLDHSPNSYSFMNYYAYPWAGGGVEETSAIRPLPDDARALRDLYPGTGSRSEVAVLTTWYNDQALNQNSAMQVHTCAPSLGDALASSPLVSYFCGTGGPTAGSTVVCAGDLLRTWFTLANYSTDTADDIEVTMHLSTDDIYDSSDLTSSTFIKVTVQSGRSKAIGKSWKVPSGLVSGERYQVILSASGTTASGAWVSDWTPLVAPVTAC